MWNASNNIDYYESLLERKIKENIQLTQDDVNIEKMCRICLIPTSNSDNLLKFFKTFNGTLIRLTDMFEDATGLQFNVNDKLPNQVCDDCIENVSRAYCFRVQCHEAEKLLFKIIDNLEGVNNSSKDIEFIETTIISDATLNRDSEFEEAIHENNDDFLIEVEVDKIDGITSDTDIQIISKEEDHDEDECLNFIQIERDLIEKELSELEDNEEYLIEDREIITKCTDDKFSENESTILDLNSDVNIHTISITDIENGKTKPKSQNRSSVKLMMSHCNECGHVFKLNKNIEEHYSIFHPTVKAFQCNICEVRFTKLQALRRHSKLHQASGRSKLCTYCDKAFTRADDLKRHIRIHTNERPYECTVCLKSYKQTSELKEHMITHSKDKTFDCIICGKSLHTRNGLYVHLKVHQGIKNHQCDICNKRFVTSGELQSHIRHIHDKSRSFLCTYENCNRSFVSKSSLEVHLRSHTGERPYKCEICGKNLASSSSLIEHKKLHTAHRNFQCEFCNKSFMNEQRLKKHMNIHESE